MLYNNIKFIHILSATLLIMSMVSCYLIWKKAYTTHTEGSTQKLQTSTWLIVTPTLIFQLFSGFYMASLKNYPMTQLWLQGSAIGFLILTTSWFGFIYCFFKHKKHGFNFLKSLQIILLLICLLTVLSMIFLMANKIT